MNDQKVVIITGGNSGLGFTCAKNIACDPGYHVILACRDIVKAEKAKSELMQACGNQTIAVMQLDVSSLASVRAFVAQYKKLNLPLYGLVLNAGVDGTTVGTSPDGFDIIFATNHLGHFLLANLLLPSVLPSGRIAVVSSDMHNPPGPAIAWRGVEALAHPDAEFSKSFTRYAYSKLCNLYFTYALSNRLHGANSKLTVNAFNPGLMLDTNFFPDKARFTEAFLQKVADKMGSLEKSAMALAQLITAPGLDGTTGAYFDRGIAPIASSPLSYDQDNALELWNASVAYTGLPQA